MNDRPTRLSHPLGSPGATDSRVGSWTLLLFGIAFGGAALALAVFLILPNAATAWQARSWIEARATLEAVHVRVSEGTVGVDARYRFTLDGETFEGTRVAVHGGSDNIGDFQRRLATRLRDAHRRGERVPVWFDPDDPSRALLDRTARPGMFAFTSAFVLLFGGIGAVALYSALRRASPTAEDDGRPWRARADWRGDPIRSDARGGARAMIAFAVLWNTLSWSVLLAGAADLADEPLAVRAMLGAFPVTGLVLAVIAVRLQLAWRRQGATPLTLARFPGTLGGTVDGHVALGRDVPAGTPVTLTLESVRHSRQGKSHRERSIAQRRRDGVVRHDDGGAFVAFSIDAPVRCPESDAERLPNRNAWYLSLECAPIGLRRRFEVPVYRDRGHHADASTARRGAEADRPVSSATSCAADRALVARALPIVDVDGARADDAITLRYGPCHGKAAPAAMFAIGSLFAAVGAWIVQQGDVLFGCLFGGFGALFAVGAFIALGTTRRVRIDGRGIEVRTRWFGLRRAPRTLAARDVVSVGIERSGSASGPAGNRHYFGVHARTRDGKRVGVAWQVADEVAARAVASLFERTLRGGDRADDRPGRGSGASDEREAGLDRAA